MKVKVRTSWNKGIKTSEETRDKIRIAKTGTKGFTGQMLAINIEENSVIIQLDAQNVTGNTIKKIT